MKRISKTLLLSALSLSAMMPATAQRWVEIDECATPVICISETVNEAPDVVEIFQNTQSNYYHDARAPRFVLVDQGLDEVDFLLVMPICILDFIKIYPLHHNSMQMSRLLMTAMLWAKHYQICKYISIERLIEDSSDEYYFAIAKSLEHWDDGFNDYKPFVKYILETILKAYKEFEKRTVFIVVEPKSKPERVEQYIMDANGEVTKREIMYYCPDISETTIEIALRELKDNGTIEKIGGGRYTKYRYKKS